MAAEPGSAGVCQSHSVYGLSRHTGWERAPSAADAQDVACQGAAS